MAEGCAAPTLAVTPGQGLSSRSRSGSSSGSSESDGSPICKISPLVAPVSSSPRPLTPKKRHRAEMEEAAKRQEEAKRQESLQATEKAKAEGRDKTLRADDKPKEERGLIATRIPKSETEIPAEPEPTSPTMPPARQKDAEIDAETKPKEKDDKRPSTKKRKTEPVANDPDVATTPAKRRPTPKKAEVATTPTSSKSQSKAPKTPSSVAVTGAEDETPLPEGWRRMVTQRMQGESAGKFDVYIWSPSGKKFRSRPQLLAYLEETGSTLSIDHFSFKHSRSSATPARLRKSPPVKEKKTATPTKKRKKAVEKTTPKKGQPKKNNVAKRSPGKQAAGKAKKGKQQRKVMKPPPDTGSKKASRAHAQQLQKLLVKINFQKPGDIREMSEDDSSEDVSEDDFDPGTAEEAGPDVSDVSLTPSPPMTKKIRRHSSPTV